MQEREKILLRKNKNELLAACKLEVFLDRADNVIEGGASFRLFFSSRRSTSRGYHLRELMAEYSYEGGLR